MDKDGDVIGGSLEGVGRRGHDNDASSWTSITSTWVAYMRNTMAADKNMNRETALMDIYRVMRPGEPPTVEAASTCSTLVLRFRAL